MVQSDDLSFGIMCAGFTFSDWQANCIENLMSIEGVNLDLIIQDNSTVDNSGGKISTFLDYRKNTNTKDAINFASWWAYTTAVGGSGPECKQPVNMREKLKDTNIIQCEVNKKGFTSYFDDDDINRIDEYDLDFILRFAFGIIRGDILETPKYGVWSFHHNDEQKYTGGPPCFWALCNGDHVTGAILQKLTDRLDGGVILKKGYFSTNKFSWHNNMNNVYYGSAQWPAQVAIDILSGTADYLQDSPTQSDAPIYRYPSPLQIAKYNARRFYSMGRRVLSGVDTWNVGIIDQSIDGFLSDPKSSIKPLWFPLSSSDKYIADPFAINLNGKIYIFVEEFCFSENKGRISYIKYPKDFENGQLNVAHEEDWHLSYPFLFTHGNQAYAIPESFESGDIRLYKVNSPSDWKLESILISDICAVDPTIYKYDGRWWLFFTKQSNHENECLHIWHSDSLTGEWIPHNNNPVKCDVRSSRPAGNLFMVNDKLYRPSQDCSKRYGWKINISEIIELNEKTFEERPTREIDPARFKSSGTHTLSSHDSIMLIDKVNKSYNSHWTDKAIGQVLNKIQ